MINRILNTSFPFIGVLVIIIVLITMMDRYAVRISKAPETIMVKATDGAGQGAGPDFLYDEELSEYSRKYSGNRFYVEAEKLLKEKQYDKSLDQLLMIKRSGEDDFFIEYKIGNIYLKQKKYSKSIAAYRQSVKLNSDFIPASQNMAIAFSKSGKYAEAEQSYLKVLTLQPNNQRTLLNMAILYTKTEEWNKCLIYSEKCSTTAGNEMRARALYYMGLAYSELEDTDKARKALNESILLKPDFLLPRIQLSYIEKDPAKRISLLKEIIALNPGNTMAYFALAKSYRAQGMLQDAELNLKMALATDPENEDIVKFLGDTYIEEKKPEDASKLFEDLLLIDSLVPQNYFYLAKTFYSKDDFTDAISFYEKAISMAGGTYPEAYLNKGLAYKKSGDNQKAVNSYRAAISQKQDYFEAYYNLAILLQEMGDLTGSKQAYLRAIKIRPKFEKAWFNLGVLYDKAGIADSASLCYQKVISLDPEHLKALMNYAINLRKNNKIQEAILAYNNLIQKYPNYVPAWYNLAFSFEKNNDTIRAIETYLKVLQLDPENTRAMKNIAEIYGGRKEYKKAENMLIEALDIESSDDELHYTLAKIYRQEKKLSEALAQFTQALEINAGNLSALRGLMLTYADQNDWKMASSTGERLFSVKPTGELAYDIGRYYQRLNDIKAAEKWLKQSVAIGNRSASVYYYLGRLYYDSNELAKAQNFFYQAIKADPDHILGSYFIAEYHYKRKNIDSARFYVNRILTKDPNDAKALTLKSKIN